MWESTLNFLVWKKTPSLRILQKSLLFGILSRRVGLIEKLQNDATYVENIILDIAGISSIRYCRYFLCFKRS